MTNTLGDRLYQLRKNAKMTGIEMGLLTGMSQSRISKIERGHLMPHLQDVESFAAVLRLNRSTAYSLIDSYLDTRRWYQDVHSTKPLSVFETYRNDELRATTLDIFSPMVISPILQTREMSRLYLEDRFKRSEINTALTTRLQRRTAAYDVRKRFRWLHTYDTLLRFRDHHAWSAQMMSIGHFLSASGAQLRFVSSDDCIRAGLTRAFSVFDSTWYVCDEIDYSVSFTEGKRAEFARRAFEKLWTKATPFACLNLTRVK